MVNNISAAGSFDLISFIILPFVFLLMSGCRPQVTHYLLRGHQFSAQPLAFSPDGEWFASTDNSGTGESSGLWLWAVNQPNRPPLVLSDYAQNMGFSPDGQWLAIFGSDVELRSMANLTASGHSFDRKTVFSVDWRWVTSYNGGNIRLWSIDKLDASPHILTGHLDNIESVAFSPDGRWLASGSEDRTIRLWSLDHFETAPHILSGHQEKVRFVAFSPDGHWLASVSADSGLANVGLWSVDNPSFKPCFLSNHHSEIWRVAFSPDGHWLLSAGNDHSVRLWSVDNPDLAPQRLEVDDDSVRLAQFSPDGRWLATVYHDRVTLRAVDNFEATPYSLIGPWFSFSPDGHWLATTDTQKTSRLYALSDLDAAPTILTPNEGGEVMVFNQDGTWLASSRFNDIHLWSISSGY
ncbi:MAG: PD40 domain-containing protein [Anaerolineales bacterium]|nr:PD40 domain-containing protein [Anaerolineales bacterium]